MNKKSDDAFLLESMRHFMLLIFKATLKQAGIIIIPSFIIKESIGLRPNQGW